MRFGSVCSGIGGADCAWVPLGWRAAWAAEIDPFAAAVLRARYPDTPNRGDFTQLGRGDDAPAIDVLVGGTPCQAFSVAGLRKGLDDARGDLTLAFLGLVGRLLPRWVVWENVPGVLSLDDGRTFGTILGRLGECGYGFAYRVLDAQYFGLAQRRRRVFVVAYRGDWRPPAAVLFEPASVSGDPPPGREAGAGVAGAPDVRAAVSSGRGWWDERDVASTVRSQESPNKADTLIAHALRADGFDASEDGTGRGTPLVAYQQHGSDVGAPLALTPFDPTQLTSKENRSNPRPGDPSPTLPNAGHGVSIASATAVRRLTPRECERLQGYPDDWTLVPYRGKPAADGPRYRALGNAFPVPVLRWIGERIACCDAALEGPA